MGTNAFLAGMRWSASTYFLYSLLERRLWPKRADKQETTPSKKPTAKFLKDTQVLLMIANTGGRGGGGEERRI